MKKRRKKKSARIVRKPSRRIVKQKVRKPTRRIVKRKQPKRDRFGRFKKRGVTIRPPRRGPGGRFKPSLTRGIPRSVAEILVQGKNDGLSKEDFIELAVSVGKTEHEAYTLWHSPTG